MSQVYSIEAKWKYEDESIVVDAVKRYVRATMDRFNYGRDFEIGQVKDIDSVMRLFFTNVVEKDSDGVYTADFNASYGWEDVMINMFHNVAPVLQNGSYLHIWPDCDEVILEVDHGVKTTRISTEDFEEE